MDYDLIKQKVVAYIGFSKKTEYEVKNKLIKLNANSEEINSILNELKQMEYVDDNDYIDSYIRQNINLCKYSIYELKQKLMQKGLNRDLIESKLQLLYDNNYEEKVVDKILKSRSKSMDQLKLKQYLYKRGFRKYNFEV